MTFKDSLLHDAICEFVTFKVHLARLKPCCNVARPQQSWAGAVPLAEGSSWGQEMSPGRHLPAHHYHQLDRFWGGHVDLTWDFVFLYLLQMFLSWDATFGQIGNLASVHSDLHATILGLWLSSASIKTASRLSNRKQTTYRMYVHISTCRTRARGQYEENVKVVCQSASNLHYLWSMLVSETHPLKWTQKEKAR